MRKQLHKLLSVLCVMTMLFAMLTPVHAAGVSLAVSGPSIEQGTGTTEADVTFTLSGNTGLAGVQLTMTYAEGLTLKKLTKGTALSSLTFTATKDFTSPVTLPWDGETADESNGLILTATFEVSKETVKDYDITVTPVTSGCYDNDLEPVTITVANGKISITEKPKENFTGLSLTDAEYTYDGTAKALSVSGVPAGAKVTYESKDFDGEGKAINAGEYSIKATVTKDGYNDWTKIATLKINKKTLTITGLLAQNKTYDGTDAATLSGGVLSGAVKGDDVSVDMPTEGEFIDKNVGDNKEIIYAVELDGKDMDNYKLNLPALKANITKAPISVKADDLSMTKGSDIPTLTYTVTKGKKYEEDAITGALATKANGTKTGTFDITQGTLKATSNYELSFTKGTLTVTDKKTQSVTVAEIGDKTYGDAAFKIDITKDENSAFGEFTFTSKTPEVATVDKDGNVTILKAGKAEITVSRKAKDDAYADYSKSITLNVKKVAITVNAEAKTKKIGAKDPELTYTYPKDALVGEDKFTGALTRKEGEAVGKYDILQGTLKINDNYDITYNKAIFEIVDKTPQTIAVAEFEEKTYGVGDESFKITVTADAESKLDVFTYASDNEKVATISEDGTITIIGAGEAKITATQAGNDEYASASDSKTLKVNPKAVTVKSVDLSEKTAALEGVLDKDNGKVALDFDKIKTTVTATETSTTDETTTVTSTLKVENFKLTGEKASNYIAETKELTTKVSKTTISEKLTEDENTTIVAAPADEKTLIVAEITVADGSETKKITIDVTKIADSGVSKIVLKKSVTDTIASTDEEIEFELVLNDNSSEEAKSSVTLDADAIDAIREAGSSSELISISVEKTEESELSDKQQESFGELKDKAPTVYRLSITDENGNSLASSFGEDGKATVVLPYEKEGRGNVIVKYLNELGELIDVLRSKYDDTEKAVTVELSHFSEYVIYTEPTKNTGNGGGGGNGTSSYTVRFVTTGGSSVDSQTVAKNASVTEPEAPVRAGYDFAGWYTDHELTTKYDFSAAVTKNLTLYAAWEDNGTEKKEDIKPEEKGLFSDVKTGDWYYESVKYAVENGLMNGTSDKTFAPNDNLTRAMLVTILYRAAGEPEVNKSIPFADVTANDYYMNAVIWAQQNEIVSGVSENEFAPNVNITREQIATIIYRYAKFKGYDVSVGEDTNILSYADAEEISEYATEAVQYAVGSGLMKGKTESTLNPKDNATRAEIATILQRFIEANK